MASAKSRLLCQLQTVLGAGRGSKLLDRQLLEQFTTDRDQSAFTALVRRHGPMVLNVCRRVLHNAADADDAFQATFLVLARKASAIGKREALPAWLHKVAYRVALRTRTGAAQREKHEQHATGRLGEDPLAAITGRELLTVLDEELQALPGPSRAPLILCYLEEQTRDEAARQLGLSVSTLKRRLEKGRATLRRRLERRGLALAAAFLTLDSLQTTAKAAVPGLLAAPTTKAAVQAVAGKPLAEVASAHVAALVVSTLRAMAMGKAIMVGTLSLTITFIGMGIGLAAYLGQAGTDDPRVQAVTRSTAAPGAPRGDRHSAVAPEKADAMSVAGQILGADGKPVAGAQVAVTTMTKNSGRGADFSNPIHVVGPVQADREGRFRLPPYRFDWQNYVGAQIVAAATGHGLGWKRTFAGGDLSGLTIQLAREQVFRGRFVDLQGQPAAGVRMRLFFVGVRKPGDVEGVRMGERQELLPFWPAPEKTDTQGRFAIRGIGVDMMIGLEVSDDRFARQWVSPLDNKAGAEEITRTLSPAHIIEGQVVAADTGKPVANASLTVYAAEKELGSLLGVSGRADAQGRFRINPHPGSIFHIRAFPPDAEPYLTKEVILKWPKGAVKQQVTVRVPSGAVVRGKVCEAASGNPIAGTKVRFVPGEKDNPKFKDNVESNTGITDAAGVFQITVVPGTGYLAFLGPTDDYVQKEMQSRKIFYDQPGGERYNAHAWQRIEARVGTPQELSLTLQRGVTLAGKLIGSTGKPVADAVMFGPLFSQNASMTGFHPRPISVPVRGGQFELHGLDPKQTYPVFFLDPKNKEGTIAQLSGKQAQAAPVTVRLSPCGSAVVRFVDARGKPVVGLSNFALQIQVQPGASWWDETADAKGLVIESKEIVDNWDRVNYWNGPATDAQGLVTLPALIPGAKYSIPASRSSNITPPAYFEVEAGKPVRLPDIQWRK